MDTPTIALIVSQTVTFLMLVISEALGINPNSGVNSILQVLGIFKATPAITQPKVTMTAKEIKESATPIVLKQQAIAKSRNDSVHVGVL